MYSRAINESALSQEGHKVRDDPAEHVMTLRFKIRDPHRNTDDRPVVDVSTPFNVLDETHKVRRFGVAKTHAGFFSLNHFSGIHEQIPYAESYHSWDCAIGAMGFFQVAWFNRHFAKIGYSGIAMTNPRMYFATSMVTYLQFARVSLSAALGSFGYFYSYEYLYTHVPGFKIRDPSPQAWSRPYDEDQSTYMARIAASIFPSIGYTLWAGRLKRSMGPFFLSAAAGVFYEYARINVLPGQRLMYNALAEKYLAREANLGSLAGDVKRKVDHDTGKNLSVSQFRYTRMTAGLLQDTIWENATHETLPASNLSYKVANPYYNWQKAPQAFNAKAIAVKNDLWKLPTVLNARNMSGVLDAR